MNRHQEFEQLSAFVDGELDAAEQARVGTHVATCAECRSTLEALRSTVTEMRALPEEVPSPQDSWALRAAIARARRQPTRWQRWAVASSSAAAAAVLIVGGILVAGGGGDSSTGTTGAEVGALATRAIDYDATSAGALLDTETARQAPAAAGGAEVASEDNMAFSTESDATGSPACAADLFEGDDTVRTFRRSIAASFEGTPAYLLIYEAADPARVELWVVSRTECRTVLFFARREL